MEDKAIFDLIKTITAPGEQLKAVADGMKKLDERMTKLEALQESNIRQNEKIEQILARLQQGSEHFERVDQRLTRLEMADGEKAKGLQKQIWNIVIATIGGALIGNLGGIIHLISGK